MKKEVMELWVKALRSGEYKQAKGVLQNDRGGYCCLGVLCDVAEKEGIKTYKTAGVKLLGPTLGTQAAVMKWAGLYDDCGAVKREVGESYRPALSGLNDSGDDFPKIADFIEKNWESL